ncbi:hypothetical protein JCM11491_002981 [Sporobolomyces phaffii]
MAPPNPPPVIPAALKKLLPRSLDAQHVSIRVRTDKKMNSLIKVALAFLRDDPDKPIVLHSFPTPRPAPATSTASSSSAPTMSLHGSNSVDAVPKLVSVVEVIKREYVRFLSEASAAAAAAATATGPVQSDKGKEKAVERVNAGKRQQGLHQYSLLTTFERLGYDTTAPTTSEGATTTTATVKDVQREGEKENEDQTAPTAMAVDAPEAAAGGGKE